MVWAILAAKISLYTNAPFWATPPSFPKNLLVKAVMPSLSVLLMGMLPFFLGVILYFWCAGAFTFIGRGTPVPIDAPVFLVRSGPYRWVCNPMYIGVFSVLIGEAILFHQRCYLSNWRGFVYYGFFLLT